MNPKIKKVAITTAKVVGWLVGGVLLLFVLIWGALQLSPVQTFVVQKATNWVSNKTKTTVKIRRVDLDFFKTVVLEGIYVEDQKKDTLLFADEFRVNIGVLGLSQKKVVVNLIDLENAVVNLNRSKATNKFNYEFIVDAFASGDTTTTTDTTSSAWTFDLEEVELDKIRFAFDDEVSGNQFKVGFAKLNTQFETLGLDKKHPHVERFLLDGLRATVSQPAPQADTLQAAVAQATQVDSIAKSVEKAATTAPVKEPTDSVFNSSGFAFTGDEIRITNAFIQYDVRNTPRKKDVLDYQHLLVEQLNLDLREVVVGANNFAADLRNFSLREQSGLDLRKLALTTKVELPQAGLQLHTFQTNRSSINDIEVAIANVRDTANILGQVRLEADFENDSLAMQDVRLFTDALNAYPGLAKEHLFLNGELNFADNTLNAQDLEILLGTKAQARLTATAERLDDMKNLRYRLDIDKIQTSAAFLRSMLPAGSFPAQAAQLGVVTLSGQAKGSLKSSDIDLALVSSNLGKISADAHLSTNEDFSNNAIRGSIRGDNLQAGKVVGSGLGAVTFVLEVEGSQRGKVIDVPSARLFVPRVAYKDYTYQNIRLEGSYQNELAQGNLLIRDPNVELNTMLSANLKPNQQEAHIQANLPKMDVGAVKLTTDTLTVGTRLQVDIKGFNPDTFVGKVKFSDLMVVRPEQKASLDSLVLTADFQDGDRTVNLLSDILQANMRGKFTLDDLPRALDQFINSYFSRYTVTDTGAVAPQQVAFNLTVKENPKLLQAMVPGLSIPQAINVKGSFQSSDNQLVLTADAPLVSFDTYKIFKFNLDTRTNEQGLSLNASTDQITTSPTSVIPRPRIQLQFERDNLSYNLRLANDDADSRLNLNGRFQIKQDTFLLRFLPSDIMIKKKAWDIAPNSLIVYGPKYLRINNFALSRAEQLIAINTKPLSPTSNLIVADFRKVSLAELVGLITTDYVVGGELNGQAQVADLFDKIGLNGNIQINGLSVNQSQLGDLTAQAAQGSGAEQITFETALKGPNNDARINGWYNTVREDNNLDAAVLITKIDLAQLNPLVQSFVAEMRGILTADLRIQGSPAKPDVKGQLHFDNTLINPLAAGVPFTFNNQTIYFTGNQVQLRSFTISDDYNRQLTLNGGVNFENLANPVMDMRVFTSGFRFLNTTEMSGQPIYGQVLAAVDVGVKGSVADMNVDGEVNVQRQTNMTVSLLDQNAEIQRPEFIIFVSEEIEKQKDSTMARISGSPEADAATGPTGMAMNLRIRANREAVFNIIIDPKTGDALTCSGRANLVYEMSPNGQMNLLGDYILEGGSYSLSLFGLVKKEFAIEKGSSINWSGDPAGANVNITAIYEARVPRYDLVQDQIESGSNEQLASAAKLQSPVFVSLGMSGTITEPTLKFDLKVPTSGNGFLDQIVNDKIAVIRNDETMLNKQVFGLIALNRFLLDQPSYTGTGGTADAINEKVGQSVSSFLSNQLNNLTQEYLGGVQIDVDLQSQMQTGSYSSSLADKQLAVNLSKNLFSDRVLVNVGSSFDLGSANNNTQSGGGANSMKNVLGNVSVEYKLVASGRIRLRFFRRQDPNLVTNATYEQVGASFLHTKSFNRLQDLFVLRRKKRQPVLEGSQP